MTDSTTYGCRPIPRIAGALCVLAFAVGLLAAAGAAFAQADDPTQAALTALAHNDWSGLYALLDDDVRAVTTEEQFTSKMSAGQPEFFDAAVEAQVTESRMHGSAIKCATRSTIISVPVILSAHAPDGSDQAYSLRLQFCDGHLLMMKPPVLFMSVNADAADWDVTHAALMAISTNDWSALYQLTDDELQQELSERAFTTKLASGPKFFDAAVTGPPTEQHMFGSTVTFIPLTLRASAADGTVQTYVATLQVIDGKVVGFKTPVLAFQPLS